MKVIVKQHDIRDCGAACLASVVAYYNVGIPIARIRQYAFTTKEGTSVYGIIQAAEKLGFVAKGVRGKIESLPLIPFPAIAHVVKKTDVGDLHHYVVLYGYKKHKVRVMDPAFGTLEWKNVSDFEKDWSGVLILFEPGDAFHPRNEKISLISRFADLVLPHKSMLLQAFWGALCYTMLGLASSFYIEKITDYVLIGGNTNLLNLLSVVMILIVILKFIIGLIQNFIVMRTGQMMDASLILGYYKHILKLPQSFFDTMQIGEITSRISDAVKIRSFINDTLIGVVVNLLIVVLSFLLMFIYYWKLALMMMAVVPLYAILYIVTDKWNKRVERRVMENAAGLESQLVESLNAEKTIKQFGLEEYSNERTENKFVKMLYSIYSSGKCGLMAGGFSEFISSLLTVVMIWMGSYFVLDGHMTAGQLMSFYALVGYFTSPVASLISSNKSIREAIIAADRLFEIMDLECEETEGKVNLQRDMVGDIVFSDVCFSYGVDKEIFENLNLRIRKGSLSAIVGESGCGKTTIANILQDLYPLKKGKVLIGEFPLSSMSKESVRSMIAAVPQQITLFSGSVLQNIAIGEYEPDLKRVCEIIRDLGLSEFVDSLPYGLNTQVGENGAFLSGGQKQRLAIARAIYKDPEILIMDEATSSLDSVSERFVQSFMDELKSRGKTIIVIAHRISTIKNADDIFVLEQGRVVEQGTFRDLSHAGGVFQKLWETQSL
ncbi:MAG: peptidase domain-containing ABC transporter [Paludibacteraceae bacterium]|nr:peptidase domain-containing ABC transporter [Paludibacteraceae bacterium]